MDQCWAEPEEKGKKKSGIVIFNIYAHHEFLAFVLVIKMFILILLSEFGQSLPQKYHVIFV